jgi:hypothetical protein
MSKTGGMLERKGIISKRLPYEITMLRDIYRRLQFGFDLQSTANLFIEGFALHARNLIDFFWDDLPLNAKDAVARHFTDELYSPFNGINPKSNGVYAKINKQISHVTYDRTDNEKEKLGQQDREILLDMIEKEIYNFACHVRPPYKELWQQATRAPKVTPALGSGRFVYIVGLSGPVTATVTTAPSIATSSAFFPADREEDNHGSKT